MYCMDFSESLRLHNEAIRMMRDSHIQMLRTIERMNERMYRILEQQPIQGQPTRVPNTTTRRTQRNNTRTAPRMAETYFFNMDILSGTQNGNPFQSLFRNGGMNGATQYYILPMNRPMENVPIPVPVDVIARTCRVYSYQEDSSGNTECPIDLTPFHEGDEIMEITHCGHRFRSSNLRRWFQTNPRCPLCRIDVRDISGNELPESTGEHNDEPNVEPEAPPVEPTISSFTPIDTSGNTAPNLESLLTSTLEELFTTTLREMREN